MPAASACGRGIIEASVRARRSGTRGAVRHRSPAGPFHPPFAPLLGFALPEAPSPMTPQAALAFVEKHGVVLVSARSAVPPLVEAIAGAPIRGSWWAHPKGREIFRLIPLGGVRWCRQCHD